MTEQFAPAEQVSDALAATIAEAVRRLKPRWVPGRGWQMRIEDWYHDLPVWYALEARPGKGLYRTLQISVLLVGNKQEIEFTCESPDRLQVQRLPISEASRVGEVADGLWAQS